MGDRSRDAMARLLVALFTLVLAYGIPWFVASVVAGGSATAQLAAAVALALGVVMGWFVAWMGDR